MEVIQHSFTLYKKGLKGCLPLSLIIAMGINAPFLFFEYQSPLDFLDTLFTWQDYKSGLMVTFWVLTFIGLESLIIKLNSIHSGMPKTTAEAISSAISDFFPLLLVAALYSIMIVCGIAFLVVPGIIFSISLMFAFIIRLIEHHDVFESLINSHKLVWGHWWYSLLVLSVPILLNLIVFLAIFISTVGILTHFSETWSHAYFFAFVLNTILQIFFIPFILSTVLSLFYDLKTKKSV